MNICKYMSWFMTALSLLLAFADMPIECLVTACTGITLSSLRWVALDVIEADGGKSYSITIQNDDRPLTINTPK